MSGRAGNALRPEADLTFGPQDQGRSLQGGVKAAVNPGPPLSASAELDLRVPGFKAADLPLKGVPAGLVLPPTTKKTGRVALVETDLELKAFAIKAGQGEVELTGKVRKALTKPDPQSSNLGPPGLSRPWTPNSFPPSGGGSRRPEPAWGQNPASRRRGLDAADIQELAVHLGASVLSVAGRGQALPRGESRGEFARQGRTLGPGGTGRHAPRRQPLRVVGRRLRGHEHRGPRRQAPHSRGTAKLEGWAPRRPGWSFPVSPARSPPIHPSSVWDSLAGDASGGRLTVSGPCPITGGSPTSGSKAA